ncbi:MAG: PilZ domain-containing protein [Deltaproteobacteria bacterium]|nr:PilZ domain-containing protein [Deltaproteobacteria bacterium]
MALQSSEKRENQRIPIDIPVSYSLNRMVWHDGRSVNINYTGMLIRAQEILTPGQLVHMVFQLPKNHWDEIIEASAEVVRIASRRSKQVGMAVYFRYLRPTHEQAIQRFIDQVSR